MNLILLGMPGAGKGTQAEIIQREQGIANVSTGAMMREVSRAETDLGKKVQEYLSTGKLVPDDIIIQMLVERISQSDCENGFLLDGFPRNLDQAKALDEAKVEINLILFLKISEKEIIERMSGRRVHLPSGRSYHIVHNPPKVEGKDDLTDKIDFIVCLGGDGTLLYASSLFQQSVPPVMAFHMGSLGFLTPFEIENFEQQVTHVLEGRLHTKSYLNQHTTC